MDEDLDPELARIDAELRRQNRPRADIGRLLGLDSAQVHRLFAGKRRLQLHEHAKVMESLGLQGPARQVSGAVVPMPGLVPLFGWVGAASDGRLVIAEQNLRGYVPMHPAQANIRDAFALEVADESMSPRYEPGEIVFVAPNRQPRAGQDCVIVTASGEGLLKRFVRRTGAAMEFTQFNPAKTITKELTAIQALHTVVGRG